MVLCHSMNTIPVVGIPWGSGDIQTLLYAKSLFERFAFTGYGDEKTLGVSTCAQAWATWLKFLNYQFLQARDSGLTFCNEKSPWSFTSDHTCMNQTDVFLTSDYMSSEMSEMKHSLSSVYVVIDLCVASTPIRFLHFIYPVSLGKRLMLLWAENH